MEKKVDIQIDNLIKSKFLDHCLSDVQGVLRELVHLVDKGAGNIGDLDLNDMVKEQIYPLQRASGNLKSIIKALKNQIPLKEQS